MKVGELIDLRKKRMVWKTTVAAGKQPTTNFDIIGVRIGQEQSDGDTSKPRMEAVGFRLKSEPPVQYAKEPHARTSIRVAELLRRVKLSSMSSSEEKRISDVLDGRRSTDVLSNRDLDQISVLANVDPSNLRDLSGL